MAEQDYKGRYMPEKVENLYKKIDSINEFYNERIKTHGEAYQKLEEKLKDGNTLKYDLLSDEDKRNELINEGIEDKINVYREKAKKEYGISPNKEHFREKSKEELDDFILTIYTGKNKGDLKSEIQDAIEKIPEALSEDFYRQKILLNQKNQAPHDEIIKKSLYKSLEGYIKDEDKKEIIDYLKEEKIDKIADTNLLQKEDLIQLLDIYNKGEKEITRKEIFQRYGGHSPPFLKPFDYSSEIKKEDKGKQEQKTKETSPAREKDASRETEEKKDKEGFKEQIRKGQVEPEKAFDMASSGQDPEMGKAIQEMASQGELNEDFIRRYQEREKENFKDVIRKNNPPAKQIYESMKKDPNRGKAISEMYENNELSQEVVDEINRLSGEEMQEFQKQVKDGDVTVEEVMQEAYQNRQKMKVLQDLYSSGEIPNDLKEEIERRIKESQSKEE